MTEEPPVERRTALWKSFQELVPWLSAFLAISTIFWTFSSNLARMQEDQVSLQTQMTALTNAQVADRSLSDTISIQLAQLQQSVADIKSTMLKAN